MVQIDRILLEKRGWVCFSLSCLSEFNLREELLWLATDLGRPVASRIGASVIDTLAPIETEEAKPRSLSKLHATGVFPFHSDTAHWLTPCRYVMLACVSPGKGDRPTLLLDSKRIPLSEKHTSLLRTTPLRVTNGRNSFFSTILSNTRSFVRFDRGCMKAATLEGTKAIEIFTQQLFENCIESLRWEAAKVLVIDNWRILHGRGMAKRRDPDRKLLRISIQ